MEKSPYFLPAETPSALIVCHQETSKYRTQLHCLGARLAGAEFGEVAVVGVLSVDRVRPCAQACALPLRARLGCPISSSNLSRCRLCFAFIASSFPATPS